MVRFRKRTVTVHIEINTYRFCKHLRRSHGPGFRFYIIIDHHVLKTITYLYNSSHIFDEFALGGDLKHLQRRLLVWQ